MSYFTINYTSTLSSLCKILPLTSISEHQFKDIYTESVIDISSMSRLDLDE